MEMPAFVHKTLLSGTQLFNQTKTALKEYLQSCLTTIRLSWLDDIKWWHRSTHSTPPISSPSTSHPLPVNPSQIIHPPLCASVATSPRLALLSYAPTPTSSTPSPNAFVAFSLSKTYCPAFTGLKTFLPTACSGSASTWAS